MEFVHSIIALSQRALSLGIALFGIGFLIGFHEFGHFIFCKMFNIHTPSFSIGVGPKLISRKIGDTEFVLSAIPLGGFVEIAGSAEMGQGDQKNAKSTADDSFAVKPYYQKFLVMMGGIFCNLLFAYLAFVALSFWGIPKTPLMYPANATTTLEHIEPDSPASKAGLLSGDRLLALNNTPLDNNAQKAIQVLRAAPNQEVSLSIMRDDQEITQPLLVGSREQGGEIIGTIGVSFAMGITPGSSFFESFKKGTSLTYTWIVRTVEGFSGIFRRGEVKNVGGPIVIISMLTRGATDSLKIFLLLLAVISINLAILNLLPLPVLDGGQLLFCTIEAIMGRPLPIKVREYIHIGSWILVLCLVIYLTINDVYGLASPYIEDIKQFFGFGR